MVKRIIRAYGAAQGNEISNVESVARLAGIQRPVVSGNNCFLRSVGILELDKPKLTRLGTRLATGIGIDNKPIITEALSEAVRTTPILSQLLNTLRARGTMDIAAFRGQIVLAAGLNEKSPTLPMVKTILDFMEESGGIEIRDDKIFLGAQSSIQENGSINTGVIDQPAQAPLTTKKLPSQDCAPPTDLLMEQLMAKFPQFDPAWTDDVKLKWFDAFERLMKGRGL